MLQNETYIGNMVQGRSVKISYKSKKCLKQDPANCRATPCLFQSGWTAVW